MWHAYNFYLEFVIRNVRNVLLRNEVPGKWKGGDGRRVAIKRVDYVADLTIETALSFIERKGP